jgi:glycopeptide antibiotics resistance protein
MPSDHLYVPALPVLLPLGLTLMVASAIVLRRRRLLDLPRLATAWAVSWYLVAVLGATMLPLRLSWGPGSVPDLYRLTLVPLVTVRPVDFVLNTVMTLPIAAALYLTLGVRDRRRVVLTAFLLSAGVETVQAVLVLLLNGNRWADTNDLVSNTLGALLGYLAFWRLMASPAVRGLAARCTVFRADPVATRPAR